MSKLTAFFASRSFLFLTVMLAFILGWTWLLISVGADRVVDFIGIENGYAVMFLVALFGGVSSFAGVTYVATIITLSAAGLSPIGLALASGLGVSIGDTAYYLLGRYGFRELALTGIAEYVHSFTDWLSERKPSTRALAIYAYTGFSPLPNDILTILLGIGKQPLLLILPPLVLGNITLTFLIAQFGGQLPFLT